ncbi:MAG: hypothetical protein ACRDYC_04570, partial [Acidimicrobiales bacterium]
MRRPLLVAILCASAFLGAACGSGTPSGEASGRTTTTSSTAATPPTGAPSTSPTTSLGTGGTGSAVLTWPSAPVTSSAIPLGDGHVTTTTPQAGYVYSCTDQFSGGGATHVGPWIDTTTNTWNSTTKLHVEGSNSWPQASHSFTLTGAERVLMTNDLPTG